MIGLCKCLHRSNDNTITIYIKDLFELFEISLKIFISKSKFLEKHFFQNAPKICPCKENRQLGFNRYETVKLGRFGLQAYKSYNVTTNT